MEFSFLDLRKFPKLKLTILQFRFFFRSIEDFGKPVNGCDNDIKQKRNSKKRTACAILI